MRCVCGFALTFQWSSTPVRNSEDEFSAFDRPFRFYKRHLAQRKSNVFGPLIPLWLLS